MTVLSLLFALGLLREDPLGHLYGIVYSKNLKMQEKITRSSISICDLGEDGYCNDSIDKENKESGIEG